jgi:hypothetical protein
MSPGELRAFISAFEDGTLPRPRWTHAGHVTAAFYYLRTFDAAEATRRIRSGILHYNGCLGVANTATSGYHETLTLFWIARVREFLDRAPAGSSEEKLLQDVLGAFGARSDLWKEYYSFDVVRSTEARRRWIAPDIGVPGL